MNIRVNKLARELGINGDILSQHMNNMFEGQLNINPNTKLSINVAVNDSNDMSNLVSKLPMEALYALQSEVNTAIEKNNAIKSLEIAIERCKELGIPTDQIVMDTFKEINLYPLAE